MNTFRHYLEQTALSTPDKILLMNERRNFSYMEVLLFTNGYAEQISSCGIKDCDEVYLRANPKVETMMIFLALQSLGIETHLVDPHQCIKDAYPIVISNEEGQFYIYKKDVRKRLRKTQLMFTTSKLSSDGDKATIIITTSGSCDKPKEVMLSQGNFIANDLDTEPLGKYDEEDIAICSLPIHHVFGLALIVCGIVLKYATFFPDNVEMPHLVKCINKYQITRMNGVPSLYKLLMKSSKGKKITSLKAGLIGGAPSNMEEAIRIEKALGMTLIPVYGMSECIGISCASANSDDKTRLSGVGKPYSKNDVQIVDNKGKPLKQGETGEVIVKSPSLCKGYKNGELSLINGYLRTGDLGHIDEKGILHIDGRIKDIIICNGNNLSSLKIENEIKKNASVFDCVVFGIHDDVKGEIPCAAVVLKEGYSESEGLNYFALTKNEIPQRVCFMSSLPQTLSGKPNKLELKKQIEKEIKYN